MSTHCWDCHAEWSPDNRRDDHVCPATPPEAKPTTLTEKERAFIEDAEAHGCGCRHYADGDCWTHQLTTLIRRLADRVEIYKGYWVAAKRAYHDHPEVKVIESANRRLQRELADAEARISEAAKWMRAQDEYHFHELADRLEGKK